MTNTNASNFRQNVFEYLSDAVLYNDVVNVNTKNGNAVLISEDEYNSMIETIFLSSCPSLKKSIIDAKNEPLSDCIEYKVGDVW